MFKEFIDGFIFSTFAFKKYSADPELPTKRAYPFGKVPINVKKIKDIIKLSKYTSGYGALYNSIVQWPTTEAECHVDQEYQE